MLYNETFIDKVISKDKGFFIKIFNRIKDIKNAFIRLINVEARAEYKQLLKAEKMYLDAIKKAGYILRGNKLVAIDNDDEEEIDYPTQNKYNSDEIQLSRKFIFKHQNFPGEKESGGSEAHRLAIWWASKDTTISGDQTLISLNGAWYLVEKFDDADNGYQVEDIITKKEYDTIYEEIKENGKSGKILSIQRAFTDYDKFYKLNYSIEGRESSVDSIQTQHGGEDTELFRVDTKKSSRGQTESNGRGDSESSGQSKQVKFSLKPSEYQKAVENIDSFESIIDYPTKNKYNSDEIKLSRKSVNYLSSDRVGQDAVRKIRSQLSKIYDGISDNVAGGIAIESGDNVYIVDSGKENGNIRFGIRHKFVILDSKLRAEYIRRTNNESIRKGYISDELSSKFRNGYDNNRASNRRQEFGK